MSQQSFFRVRIEHALVTSNNGLYYFRERQDAEDYIRQVVDDDVQEFGNSYFNGCDGCGYCCYGDVSRKEWCQVISRKKPQTIQECFTVKDNFPAGYDYCFDVNLDMVMWGSPCASKFAHVEELWCLCGDLAMEKLSSLQITC